MASTMNVVTLTVWALSMPLVYGVDLLKVSQEKSDYASYIYFGNAKESGTLSFRDRNSQIPFFSNILGYSMDLRDQTIVITSGLLQTAWKCDISKLGDDTKQQLSYSDSNDQCERFRPDGLDNLLYKGSQTGYDKDKDFNKVLKGTFATWAVGSLEYGTQWGRSVSLSPDGKKIAIGCPGCTGQGRSPTLKFGAPEGPQQDSKDKYYNPKALSGLIFEFEEKGDGTLNGGTAIDTSFTASLKYKAADITNADEGCGFKDSMCQLGTSVAYANNGRLLASRGRSSRRLWYSSGTSCPTNTNPPRAVEIGGLCLESSSVSLGVGDILDLTNQNEFIKTLKYEDNNDAIAKQMEITPELIGTTGTILHTLTDWGYTYNTQKFEQLMTQNSPKQSYENARIGQSVVTGKFLFDNNGLKESDRAVGAPGYGLQGAVLFYDENAPDKSLGYTGLRQDIKTPTFILACPDEENFVKANFGYSLHAYYNSEDKSKWTSLAVGAPTALGHGVVFLFDVNEDEGGFLEVGMLQPDQKSDDFYQNNDRFASARFGSSITTVHLDGDKEDREIIVGAPFTVCNSEFNPDHDLGFCGAIFVFRKALSGTGYVQEQTIFGKDNYGMIGHGLVASSTHVFASAPGGFGVFNRNFLGGRSRSGNNYWRVTPKIVRFSGLKSAHFVTSYSELKVFSTSNTDVTDTKSSQSSSLVTINPLAFKTKDQSFKVFFKIQGSNDLSFYFVVPQNWGNHITISTGGTTCLGDGFKVPSTLCKFTNTDSNPFEASVTFTINTSVDSFSASVQPFAIYQVINTGEDITPSRGSTMSASINVEVKPSTPLKATLGFQFADDNIDTRSKKVLRGAEANTLITIQNDDTAEQAFLVGLNIQIENVYYTKLKFTFADSNGNKQNIVPAAFGDGDPPITTLKYVIDKLDAGEKREYNLDMSFIEVFNKDTNVVAKSRFNVTLTGFQLQTSDNEPSKYLDITAPNECQVSYETKVVKEVADANKNKIAQGSLFDFITTVTATPGFPYLPKFKSSLEDHFDIISLDPDCDVKETTKGKILECGYQMTKRLRFDFGVLPVPTVTFRNKLAVGENFFPPLDDEAPVDPEAPTSINITLVTDYTGDRCSATSRSDLFTVVSDADFIDPPSDNKAVPLWVYLVSVLGLIFVVAAVVLILWALGFFKRHKPPTDDNDGQLDEVEAASVLRD